ARLAAAAVLVFCAVAWPVWAALEPSSAMQVVSQLVARIFEQTHYSHRPIDAALSRQWLRLYLDYFDYNHMVLSKSDVDEFTERYGDKLGDEIKDGNIAPAYEIFDRFLQRLESRKSLAEKIAASSPTFTADESIVVDRHELPWPAGEKEAAELWRLRVKYDILQERLSGTKPEEQVKTVLTRYDRLMRSYKEFDSSDVLQAYLSALARSYDPHSDYMAAAQAENFSISMRLSLVGIGAVLRSEDGYAKIVSLVPGGPAATDGRLKANDRIEAVGQGDGPLTDVVGMKLDRLVQLIRGEKGSTVRLRVVPAESTDVSSRTIISLVRDEIKLTDQEARAKIYTTPASWAAGRPARIGVINLPSFYADLKGASDAKSTTRDVQKLLGGLQRDGIDGLVLDLRQNGGGSLAEAISLTRVFINDGPVVQVKDTRGLVKVLRTPSLEKDTTYQGPMAVLTSHASASASEILAAALQDYGRAVVIGNKSTYGKGTVQSVVELDQYMPSVMRAFKPGSLKLTIQKFYRVTGGSTQDRGVIPDIRLPSMMDLMDITESALKNALPYDEITPAPFRRLDAVKPVLKRLTEDCAERVAASPEFDYIREDMERYKKQQADKTISLDENARRAEKKAEDDRLAARKAARLARKKPKLAEIDITLAAIDGVAPPAPPATSTATKAAAGPADEDEEVKDPSAPDVALEESLRVVSDWIRLTTRQRAADNTPAKAAEAR
ncbi:MAG: carboxy terminal-processing peptidase, partial [Elusimicrobia bacterium]|nr:carboxy terminal-processing peptidase [Elusimicrobiota bacterium]